MRVVFVPLSFVLLFYVRKYVCYKRVLLLRAVNMLYRRQNSLLCVFRTVVAFLGMELLVALGDRGLFHASNLVVKRIVFVLILAV
jgi:hypothetical protein